MQRYAKVVFALITEKSLLVSAVALIAIISIGAIGLVLTHGHPERLGRAILIGSLPVVVFFLLFCLIAGLAASIVVSKESAAREDREFVSAAKSKIMHWIGQSSEIAEMSGDKQNQSNVMPYGLLWIFIAMLWIGHTYYNVLDWQSLSLGALTGGAFILSLRARRNGMATDDEDASR